MKKASEARVLTAVGSRHDQRCSVGTFARAEAQSLKKFYASSDLLEPTADGIYPQCGSIARPDLILFHAPSLYDRRRPWNALLSAGNLRKNFQKAKFVVVVHEYSEAPRHWQLRVIALLRLACAVIVHSDADREALGRWHRWVVKAPLSPCLFVPEFFGGEAAERRAALLPELLGKARAALPKETDLKTGEKLVLHPGLLVPGKGVNFLGRLEPYLAGKARLVVMGGLGPKERDKIYARRTIEELRKALKGRLSFIEGPDDEVFARLLLAADLIVLPYDAGISERRSSFFSAVACGGNVLTTSGRFTSPLGLERSGAHVVPVERWAAGDTQALQSVTDAFLEDERAVLTRRLKNLAWAEERSWENRAALIMDFISTL